MAPMVLGSSRPQCKDRVTCLCFVKAERRPCRADFPRQDKEYCNAGFSACGRLLLQRTSPPQHDLHGVFLCYRKV